MDNDPKRAAEIAAAVGTHAYSDHRELIGLVDALMNEIRSFIKAVHQGLHPRVSGREDRTVLETALKINASLKRIQP